MLNFGFSFGVSRLSSYNPSIRYTWKSQTNQDGTRLLKDLTTPKYPAELNSGLALEYNGVDEGCVVTLPTGEPLHLYRFNYTSSDYDYELLDGLTAEYDLGKENGTGDYINRQSGLMYVSKSELTPSTDNPGGYLTLEGGILKSDVLSAGEIADVVYFSTGLDSDSFVRDLVGYSEALRDDFDSGIGSWTEYNTVVTVADGQMTIDDSADAGGTSSAVIELDFLTGHTYLLSVEVVSTTTSLWLGAAENATGAQFETIVSSLGVGKHSVQYTPSIDKSHLYLNTDGSGISVAEYIIVLDTGFYPIDNYLEAMHKKQLTTGLQPMLGWELDSLGVPIAKHNAVVWSESADIVPALKLPITDTELNINSSFVIHIVADLTPQSETTYYLDSRNGTDDGIVILLDTDGTLQMRLYDGTDFASVESIVDGIFQAAFEVTPTDMIMILDGVAGTSVSHSLSTSGNSFASSTSVSLVGRSNVQDFWYGEKYEKYDREKSIKLGEKAKGKI